MNILITAGGTNEKIDNVRTITNSSTGKLGSAIADAFVEAFSETDALQSGKIYYICGQNAVTPESGHINIIRIGSVNDLVEKLTEILTTSKIDAVIHSMAVSDYTVDTLTTKSSIASAIADFISRNEPAASMDQEELSAQLVDVAFSPAEKLNSENKISSDIDDMVIVMKKTPKVIGLIKKLQPATLLVGFKLLSSVPLETLIDTGYNLLLKNNCDLVLANDLSGINEYRHRGFLISPDKTYETFVTKSQIAKGIVKQVCAILNNQVP